MSWTCGYYQEFNFTHVIIIDLEGIRGKYLAITWIWKTQDPEGVWMEDIFGWFPAIDENQSSMRRGKRGLS